MKSQKPILSIVGLMLVVSLGCTTPLAGTPTPLPVTPPTATPVLLTATPLPASPTPLPPSATLVSPTSPPPSATITPTSVTPSTLSGPYGVVSVLPGDVLNIRAAPGADKAVVGAFPPTITNVMRTGPTTMVGDKLWLQVQNPGGGIGWVNAEYLTEYAPPSTFCGDARVQKLITNLKTALTTSNGDLLSTLVSPAHGVNVHLWRYGTVVNYDGEHAKWLFTSTYQVNWGPAPGSGLDTIGAFREAVLPKLLEVVNADYELHCNDVGVAAPFAFEPWPPEYANVNFYNVYKPGTPGLDLDWLIWLAGIEYVGGKPYLFALIHFQWEP